MPINLNALNKIDPVIVNNVQQQTAEGVVHTTERTRVSKDKSRSRDGQGSRKGLKDKLDKFNALLETMDIDANFTIDGDRVTVMDKSGSLIRTYDENAVVDLLINMEDMIGIFIDIKR